MPFEITMGSSGHGSYCHLYPFQDNSLYANPGDYGFRGCKTWEDVFKLQVEKQNVKNRLAIQVTLTGEQIAYHPEYTKWLKEAGFVPIFAHINPNTQRTIHTFWLDPPKYEGKPVAIQSFTGGWYEKNKYVPPASGYYLYNGTQASHVSYHGGGCCGWRDLFGVKTQRTAAKHTEQLIRICGEMTYYGQGRATATQLVLDKQEALQYEETDNLFNALNTSLQFRQVYSYHSGLTGRKMMFLVSHNTRDPQPLYEYPK